MARVILFGAVPGILDHVVRHLAERGVHLHSSGIAPEASV